jgi:hypothetical protein
MNQFVRTAALILAGGALISVLGLGSIVEYNQGMRTLSNRDRLDAIESHTHDNSNYATASHTHNNYAYRHQGHNHKHDIYHTDGPNTMIPGADAPYSISVPREVDYDNADYNGVGGWY